MRPRLSLRGAAIGAPAAAGFTIGRLLIGAAPYGMRSLGPWLARAPTPVNKSTAAAAAPSSTPSAADQSGPPPARLLLEADTGQRATGIFLVENTRHDRVSAELTISAFVDGAGRLASPAIGFSPSEICLEPGEHVLVRVVALVDQALEPNVRYLAEIAIPGLSSSRVPIAVCRRVGRPAPTDDGRMPLETTIASQP
jgi:hypothetical protein